MTASYHSTVTTVSEQLSGREVNRRRMMFVAGEDFYFLAYTTLLILDNLKCTTSSNSFSDLRKVAYLADLLGSDADLGLALATTKLSEPGRARLALLYDRAAAAYPLEPNRERPRAA